MDKRRKKFEDAIVACRPTLIKRASRLKMGSLIQDAVQEAYSIALAKENWEEIRDPRVWMLGVMDNLILKWKSRVIDKDKKYFGEMFEKDNYSDCHTLDDMIYNLDQSEKMNKIIDAIPLSDLSAKEKHIFVSRLRGKEYDLIAQELNIGRESAVTYQSNALRKIKKQIQKENIGKNDYSVLVEKLDAGFGGDYKNEQY